VLGICHGPLTPSLLPSAVSSCLRDSLDKARMHWTDPGHASAPTPARPGASPHPDVATPCPAPRLPPCGCTTVTSCCSGSSAQQVADGPHACNMVYTDRQKQAHCYAAASRSQQSGHDLSGHNISHQAQLHGRYLCLLQPAQHVVLRVFLVCLSQPIGHGSDQHCV
jgi:hypothetical protein